MRIIGFGRRRGLGFGRRGGSGSVGAGVSGSVGARASGSVAHPAVPPPRAQSPTHDRGSRTAEESGESFPGGEALSRLLVSLGRPRRAGPASRSGHRERARRASRHAAASSTTTPPTSSRFRPVRDCAQRASPSGAPANGRGTFHSFGTSAAVRTVVPPGAKATARTTVSCVRGGLTGFPVTASQSRAVRSALAGKGRARPSGAEGHGEDRAAVCQRWAHGCGGGGVPEPGGLVVAAGEDGPAVGTEGARPDVVRERGGQEPAGGGLPEVGRAAFGDDQVAPAVARESQVEDRAGCATSGPPSFGCAPVARRPRVATTPLPSRSSCGCRPLSVKCRRRGAAQTLRRSRSARPGRRAGTRHK